MKINVDDVYRDCAYHPVKCTKSDGDDIEGVSLVDGSKPRCCSIKHCGVVKLTIKQAMELVDIWKKGEKAVLMYHGWTEEAADNFIKNWRS